MENVVLTIHLILAVLLSGAVLLQRSEGGGLGMGGGGGGLMTGRQAANAMTRLTWIFGIALFVTSVALTVIAARQSSTGSIMDQLGLPEQQQSEGGMPSIPTYTPPPTTGGDPLTPPAPEAEAIAPPAADDQPAAAPAADQAGDEAGAEETPAQSGN